MGVLLAIHVFVTIFLMLVVLLQKSEGGSSLFASSGSAGGMMSARGATNFITMATWISAAIFLGNCILMAAIDSSHLKSQNISIVAPDQQITK